MGEVLYRSCKKRRLVSREARSVVAELLESMIKELTGLLQTLRKTKVVSHRVFNFVLIIVQHCHFVWRISRTQVCKPRYFLVLCN